MNVVQVFLSPLSSVQAWPIFCCICLFNFCRKFCGKLLFLAISYIDSHSFCFSPVLMEESTF